MEPTIILEKRVAGLNQRVLAAFVTQASREVGLAGAVTVMVTGSREMRRLNFRFRGKDHSTDVLSFPAPGFVNGFAGDIAICLDVADGGRLARAACASQWADPEKHGYAAHAILAITHMNFAIAITLLVLFAL